MTRFLVTGASGMLGRDLQVALEGRDVVALSRSELDITDPDAVTAATAGVDVIVNAAAYTKVDDAESHPEEAHAINATGAGIIARAARARGAKLVQLSTDYVFDGLSDTPYREDTPRDPVSVYGRTKAEGERLALDAYPEGTFIVRTAWLYGQYGPNFASTMLRLAKERDTVDVVIDQVGQPTWSLDLANAIVELVDSGAPSDIYHVTNSGQASWYDYARFVFELAGHDPDRVKPTESSRFVRPAPRPSYSVLGHDAWYEAGLTPLRNWRDALQAAFSSGALAAT
ncbi:dTDP-4-dehydrorhamnose reductase [soil metagenome]